MEHTSSSPVLTRDPRFRAGRTLVQRGQCESAVDLFATLLEQARQTYSASGALETAPAYYEYGNALFRTSQQENGQEEEEEEELTSTEERQKQARQAAADAAAQRFKTAQEATTTTTAAANSDNDSKPKPVTKSTEVTSKDKQDDLKTDDTTSSNNDDDDVTLALEMMETAWSILDANSDSTKYAVWIKDQMPRYLTGIGDVLSALQRHPDAVDAYCRALEHRQQALQGFIASFSSSSDDNNNHSLEFLQHRRKVVEANVLIAEELLACEPDQDVITSETHDTLVPAAERVDYARGYYDKARDELQETVLLMGEMAASGKEDIQEEKENICFVATMVMGVGTSLAELDEQQQEQTEASTEPVKKKVKKI